MFTTPLKIYHLPAPLADVAKHEVMEYRTVYEVRELIASLNGEGSDRDVVHQMTRTGEYPFEVVISDDCSEVTIRTKEGDELCYSRPSLVRRFHFFDDFLSTFPEAEKIEVPFYSTEVMGSLQLDESDESVADCLECMRYFNPKKADEYFQLKYLGKISDKDLFELIDDLTEEEVTEMIEARQFDVTRVPLPRGGRDRPALACILESFAEIERLKRMFPTYPSYLVTFMIGHDYSLALDMLLTEDFSRSKERSPAVGDYVLLGILGAISSARSKEEVGHLLAMLGVRDTLFGNEKKEVVAPYCLKFDKKKLGATLEEHRGTLSTICSALRMNRLDFLLVLSK